MLGDNMEKSKNPLKKAMRRRNAKTVQFAAPTYVEASDYEYDTEDEDNALLADQFSNGTAVQFEDGTEDEHAEHREGADAEDLKSRMSDSSSSNDTTTDAKPPVEEPLGSPSLVDSTGTKLHLMIHNNTSLTSIQKQRRSSHARGTFAMQIRF